MKKIFVLLLFTLCLQIAFSQTKSIQKSPPLSTTAPELVGMSTERLDRLDAMIEKAIAEQAIPGAVALVARKGKIIYQKAFGLADNPQNKALKTDDIFRIASQTKAITATAVMMLWEEGHFRLDDPISKWIPEFKNPKVLTKYNYSDGTYNSEPAKREITIRHLLTHTAGIGYGVIDPDESFQMLYAKEGIREISSMEPLTTEQNIKKLAKMPLHFHPGDDYLYSMGLDVLGYFVEIISGMTFEEYLHQHIFEPLGMNDTYFYLPDEKKDRLVTLQVPTKQGWIPLPPIPYDASYPIGKFRTQFSGGGGLSSTAKDYATFLQMYLNGGELNGIRLLSRTTIQSMMGNQIGDFWGDNGKYYGLAFGVVDENGEDKGGIGSKGTFDWGGAFNTQYFADPKEEIIGILMKQTQNAWADQTGWQFRQIISQAVIGLGKHPVLTTASPESVGMSTERLDRIDEICEKAIKNDDIPGAVALVAKDGKIVYHKAFGSADNGNNKSLKKDAIFRIASQTKAVTATAVMMLWEEGHFQLDDPISRWIPEFKDPQVLTKFKYSDTTYTAVPAESEITIRQLLTHTSGLGYGVIDPKESIKLIYEKAGIKEFAPMDNLSTADNIKKLATLPLHFNPGEKFLYSMGLDVLVYFVEIVSGQSFAEFVESRIFQPLGMNDTYFHLPQEKGDRLVSVQYFENGKWVQQPITSYDPAYPLKVNKNFASGGAGLVSTATDYATFLQMYLNGGALNGTQILSPTTIRSIMGNHIGDFWGNGGKYYGLAFGVVTEKGEAEAGIGSEGTFDWGGYFNTQYFADPKEGIIGILMKQTQNTATDKTGWQFRQLVGQAVDN